LKKGGASSPATIGPKTLANPKPTRVGKIRGVQVGASLQENLAGFSASEKDKTLANPKPTRVGKWGARGTEPPWQGVWGMCPQNKKGGELPTLATPPRVGPKTPANPQPTGVGKWGSRGRKPPGGWHGGCPPTNSKKGRVARISNPATSGAQNAGKP
jgi:hypothetical protein